MDAQKIPATVITGFLGAVTLVWMVMCSKAAVMKPARKMIL